MASEDDFDELPQPPSAAPPQETPPPPPTTPPPPDDAPGPLPLDKDGNAPLGTEGAVKTRRQWAIESHRAVLADPKWPESDKGWRRDDLKKWGVPLEGDAPAASPTPAASPAAPTKPAGTYDLPAVDVPAPSGGGMMAYRGAIASIESGGNYGIVGPRTKTGDRAYGKYQVMGANIPSWTQEALGRRMTPEEFRASPAAQDAVFDFKFGQAIAKYGSPQDAAAVWFSGRPMSQAGGASDVLGTTVPGYVAKFNAALKGGGAGGPPSLIADADLFPSYQGSAQQTNFSFMDAASAALRHETLTGIIAERLAAPSFMAEPFFWNKEMEKGIYGDLSKADQDYIRDTAISPAHAQHLREEALDRLHGEQALAQQGFFGASGLMLGAGLVDLPGWLAGGVAGKVLTGAREAGALGRIAQAAGIGAAAMAPVEIGKANTDPNYTGGDAVSGIAQAALFGGGLGALGEAVTPFVKGRFRELAGYGEGQPEGFPGAASVAGPASVGAEVAAKEAPAIAPTAMDKAANYLAKRLDFSTGGLLYHSSNDMISELAPKLGQVATQDLTAAGVKVEESALEFAMRTNTSFNARVDAALERHFAPWAKEQGVSLWGQHEAKDRFFKMAQEYHTDPNWQNVTDVDPKVAAFVGDMRKLFADHIELGKQYGWEKAEAIQPDDLYLPRYYARVKWRAARSKYGVDGLEEVVGNAIKAADPDAGQKVGARIIERAASRTANKEAHAPRLEVSEAGPVKNTLARDATAPIDAQAKNDIASARADADGKLRGPVEELDLNDLRASAREEVAYWRQVAEETHTEARTRMEGSPEHAKLMAEHKDLTDFADKLEGEVEEALKNAFKKVNGLAGHASLDGEFGMQLRHHLSGDDGQVPIKKGATRIEDVHVRIERDTRIKSIEKQASMEKAAAVEKIKARIFAEEFGKRMEAFQDKFLRRLARKFVATVDASIEGQRPAVDTSLTTRDTALLRDALKQAGVVVDEDLADSIADMMAPRSQRGPQNTRRRATLDENAAFTPGGFGPQDAISMRDLMEHDYEQIVSRYSRTMSPNYIMAKHGFQSESAVRKYIADAVQAYKGDPGYTESKAYRDAKRANYLVDMIYGRTPEGLRNVDPKWRGLMSVVSNFNYARMGGSFGIAQTFDSANLVLRHGFEAFQRGVPAWKELVDALKQGGPHAEQTVRDLQIYAGIGLKGQEAKVVPNFVGLEDAALADDLTGTQTRKWMRATKSMSNVVGHVSGLNALTDVQHLAAARIWLQTLRDVQVGRRTLEPRFAVDSGITPENITKFSPLLDAATYDKNGVFRNLNVEAMRKIDPRAFDEMMGLTRREAFKTILEPNAALLPMWAGNTVMGKFAAQLKSFSMASHAMHTLGGVRLGPSYAATAVVGGAAWATLLYAGWTYVRSIGMSQGQQREYLDRMFKPSEMAFNVWSRVGVAGLSPDALGGVIAVAKKAGLVEDQSFGSEARASGLIYGTPGQIPVVSMMGTLADTLQTGIDSIKEGRGWTRQEVRKATSLIPLQNAIGVVQALNAMTAHLPDKKKETK